MIENNTASNIGDTILITGSVPIVGIVSLDGYTDTTIGENGTRYFTKEFSYSTDGIFFTEWQTLNNTNVSSIQITTDDAFYINYRYTRQGSDSTGLLEWQNTHLLGEFTEPVCPNYFVLPKSIFKDYFCHNPQQLGLCSVLTKKMFDIGILPEYIERNQTDEPQIDDRDFLDFWDAVCCFFSLIIVFSQQFIDIEKRDLLVEYLKQRGLYFCEEEVQMAELLLLKNNFYDQIRQRGTNQTIMSAKQKLQRNDNSSVIYQYDGEFLKLICYDDLLDEFIFNLCDSEKIGWNIGNSSPCYKGVSSQKNLNKSFDDTEDVENFGSYNKISYPDGDCVSFIDGSKKVIRVSGVSGGGFSGLGANFTDINLLKDSINIESCFKVDPNIDYEITIQCKMSHTQPFLSFGVIGLDHHLNIYDLKRYDVGVENFFFERCNLNNTDYQKFRGIIYNRNFNRGWNNYSKYRKGEIIYFDASSYLCRLSHVNKVPNFNPNYWTELSTADFETNIRFGRHLKFSDQRTNRILPIVILDNRESYSADRELFIYDIKIRPLVNGNFANQQLLGGSFSTGFIQLKNLTTVYFKNNNHKKTTEEINKIAERYLLPYNCVQKQILL